MEILWKPYGATRGQHAINTPSTRSQQAFNTHMARRLAALLLLAPALDANYATAKSSATPLLRP